MATKQVFICYSRRDRAYVDDLAQWLEGHGVNAWYDHHIDYGTKWEDEIVVRLDGAECLVVIMSHSARGRPWIKRELEHARGRRIPVYPLLLENDGVIDMIEDLQFDNVIGAKMPSLALCQKLPGFLATERDLMAALSDEQRAIADRLRRVIGGLRPGMTDPRVVALQTELVRVGLDPGDIDGDFGSRTARAVRDFQHRRSPEAVVDGSIGPLTAALLVNATLGDLAPPHEQTAE